MQNRAVNKYNLNRQKERDAVLTRTFLVEEVSST